MAKWRIMPEESHRGRIKVNNGEYGALFDWEGCVDFFSGDDEYIHVCELDETIQALTEIRDIRSSVFDIGAGPLSREAYDRLIELNRTAGDSE